MSLMQDYAFLGAIAGLTLGVFDCVAIRWVLSRMPVEKSREQFKQRQTLGTIVMLTTIIGFPICGYLVGPYVMPAILG